MFRNILISAFGAGLAVCVTITAVQSFTTTPLILEAERHESAHPARDHHDAAAAPHAHETDGGPWSPADGIERVASTALANLVVGVAVSLMLLGGMALRSDPPEWRRGILWGAGGFAAAVLLPSLGLPPELPGTPAAELAARQAWWLSTAAASAAGIAALAFGRSSPARVFGIALIALPHLVGAPAPPGHEVAYPGALAGKFAVASLAVSALLWTMSGAASAWLFQRLSRA